MTSWFTINESAAAVETSDAAILQRSLDNDDDHDDGLKNKEFGILDLRSKYAEGLNDLHCSECAEDERWFTSKANFEEIIEKSMTEIPEESTAASNERKLLAFLSCSNLSRMLSKSPQWASLALHYALEAATMLSLAESTRHDPGLLLRLAKLTMDSGDYWSCKQILDYRINNRRSSLANSGVCRGTAPFLAPFYALREELNRRLSSIADVSIPQAIRQCEESRMYCSGADGGGAVVMNVCASRLGDMSTFNRFARVLDRASSVGNMWWLRPFQVCFVDEDEGRAAMLLSPESRPAGSSSTAMDIVAETGTVAGSEASAGGAVARTETAPDDTAMVLCLEMPSESSTAAPALGSKPAERRRTPRDGSTTSRRQRTKDSSKDTAPSALARISRLLELIHPTYHTHPATAASARDGSTTVHALLPVIAHLATQSPGHRWVVPWRPEQPAIAPPPQADSSSIEHISSNKTALPDCLQHLQHRADRRGPYPTGPHPAGGGCGGVGCGGVACGSGGRLVTERAPRPL